MQLTDDDVLAFLLTQPDFFVRNAQIVEQMRIPHPVRGSVSLVEWQLNRQRLQIRTLEEEITTLMEHASANEVLFSQLIALQAKLLCCQSLQELLDQLDYWARSMGLAGASIRLFSDKWRLNAPSNYTYLALSRQLFEPLRIQRMQDRYEYLGTLNAQELLLLLPQSTNIGSVALSMFGRFNDLGVIIFSSRNSQHYQPGMGTLLLDYLNTILPVIISRWIERL